MGKDQADVLKSWRDWEAIPGLATICVADRDLLTGDLSGFKPPAGMENRFLVPYAFDEYQCHQHPKPLIPETIHCPLGQSSRSAVY